MWKGSTLVRVEGTVKGGVSPLDFGERPWTCERKAWWESDEGNVRVELSLLYSLRAKGARSSQRTRCRVLRRDPSQGRQNDSSLGAIPSALSLVSSHSQP